MKKSILLIFITLFLHSQHISNRKNSQSLEDIFNKNDNQVLDEVLLIEVKDGEFRFWTIHDLLKEWPHLPVNVRKVIRQDNNHAFHIENNPLQNSDLLLQYESYEEY